MTKKNEYMAFEKTIRQLVNDDNKLVDFNSREFKWFTSNYSNYIDHGHLSRPVRKSSQTKLNTLLVGST